MAYVKPQDQMNDAERVSWERDAECLLKRSIVGRNAQWHVKHAQQFCYGLLVSGLNIRLRKPQTPPASLRNAELDSLPLCRSNEHHAFPKRVEVFCLEVLFPFPFSF
jgi:hypothetical protein